MDNINGEHDKNDATTDRVFTIFDGANIPDGSIMRIHQVNSYVAIDFNITNDHGAFPGQHMVPPSYYATPYGGDGSTNVRDHAIGFGLRTTEFPLLYNVVGITQFTLLFVDSWVCMEAVDS
ncbi:unnamed protein product [Absidia cylindrospora]